jgi:hypothetical protein
MRPSVTVSSDFRGVASITQTINGKYTQNYHMAWPYKDDVMDTDGKYYRDGSEIYASSPIMENDPLNLSFSDCPQSEVDNVYPYNIRIKADFLDYVRFRPNAGTPANNIYVTLATFTWSMWGEYWTQDGGLTVNVVPAATALTTSTQWPDWEGIKSE